MFRPRIGLTMGDPAGVGPEIVLRAIASEAMQSEGQLVVLGDWATLQKCAMHLGWPVPQAVVLSQEQFLRGGEFSHDRTVVVDHALHDLASIDVGKVAKECGEASFRFIQTALDAAVAGRLDAVVTAPINKEALHAAGHNYPGHTEIFAERAGSDRWCMMQYSPKITCTFVTVHCGYAEVPQLLTTQRVLDTIELTAQALQQIRGRRPRLVACGLNPHAGEHGLFGNREEERIIEPAIQLAKDQGIDIVGPLPPDTVFLPDKLAACDAVVCMYHDQGHIPLKALAFDTAVNTTLGLSVIRTSVDHGTAFDIAWQGIAKPDSLFSAIRLASKLAQDRS